MVHTSRRQLLAVGGLAAIAGCLSSDDDDSSDPVPEADDDEPIFASIPAEVDGVPLATAQVGTVYEDVPRASGQFFFHGDILEDLELTASEVEESALMIYRDPDDDDMPPAISGGWLLTGSFDADEPTVEDDMEEDAEIMREDGLLAVGFRDTGGGDEEPWPALLDAIEATSAGDRDDILADDEITRVYDHIEGAGLQSITANIDPEYPIFAQPPRGGEDISVSGTGIDPEGDRTVEATHVFGFDNESAVDEAVLEAYIQQRYEGEIDPEIDSDGRFLVGEFTHQFQPEPDRQASPDVRLWTEYDAEDRVVTLEHGGEESVPTDELHAFVDDEPVEIDWGTSQLEEGDTATLSAAPLTAVRVEWRDPDDEETFDVFAEDLVYEADAFTPRYDPEQDAVVIAYDGPSIDQTDRLELMYRPETEQGRAEETTERVSERTGQLQSGDELVVDDAELGGTVRLSATYETEQRSTSTSIVHFPVRPPGRFTFDRAEATIVFYGETEQDPDQYRVTIDDEPVATQFADEYDTLQPDNTLEVDVSAGEYLAIEWTGGDEPYEMRGEVIPPNVEFELYRAIDQYVLEYTSDEAWPAEEFELVERDDPLDTQFTDEYDTLEDGDTVELAFDLELHFQVEYTGGREPVTLFRSHPRTVAEFAFEFDSDGSTLTYDQQGEWPADAFEVHIDDESIGHPFADEYDTVTEGDQVEVDVGLAEELSVVYEVDGDERPLFSTVAKPDVAFEPTYHDDEIELTYEGEDPVPAELLAIDLYERRGEPEELDPWGDSGDVEPGDTVRVEVSAAEGHLVIEFGEHHIEGVPLHDPEEE